MPDKPSDKPRLYPLIGWSAAIPFFGAIIQAQRYNIIDHDQLLIMAGIIAVISLLLIWGSLKIYWTTSLQVLALLLSLAGVPLGIAVNQALNKTVLTTIDTIVVDKDHMMHSRRYDSPLLGVMLTIGGQTKRVDIYLPRQESSKCKSGDKIRVVIANGSLGISYVAEVRPTPATSPAQ